LEVSVLACLGALAVALYVPIVDLLLGQADLDERRECGRRG
jgi:hypothetical protein